MSRYYRTSMGDDPATATPATKPETKVTSEDMPRPKKHLSRPRPSAPTSPDGSIPASVPSSAPSHASPRHPVTSMPVKHRPVSKDRDKHLALLKEEVGLSKSNRRLLMIGGAAVGLGVLALLFTSGGERGRSR